MAIYTRLPLKKAYNTRELGGYPTVDSQVTAFGQFLRSDDVTNLTVEDVNYLLDYGLSAVLDLRSDLEVKRAPNPLANHESIEYLHQSILTIDDNLDMTGATFKDMSTEDQANLLGHLYIHILESSQEEIKEIFTWFSKQQGCVLFHCTAGKDRTGVIAMLLLGLSGVGEADIVANYAVTEIYNARNPQEVMMNLPIEIPEAFLASRPSFIQKAYHYIIEGYKTVENYLLEIGVKLEDINRVKNKLVVNVDN